MYEVKVFVVQKADGELVAVKLTRAAAQSFAKYHAPAKITVCVADKDSLDARPIQDPAET
jgi:RIO-like serine/threonine protein kinase